MAVDERIVGYSPKTLNDSQAASIPLTMLTAWEGLFDVWGLKVFNEKIEGKILLVLPGAGGVGGFVIQLASKLLGLKVVATASRDKTIEYCKKMGATYVINHRENLKTELNNIGISGVD